MLNLQEIVKIIREASPLSIPNSDLEKAILEQQAILKNGATKVELINLQVLYYLAQEKIGDADFPEAIDGEVKRDAAEIYLAYKNSMSDFELLMPCRMYNSDLLQVESDAKPTAVVDLEQEFENDNRNDGKFLEPSLIDLSKEHTLALIKPDAYGAGKKDAIVERILQAGFIISEEIELVMSMEQAMEFYREHEGKPFYEKLVNWMSSAPIYAMILEKPDAVTAWRTLAGPTNSNTAREIAPESLRALYGTDGSQNAVHGSDSKSSAERERKIIFGVDFATADNSIKSKNITTMAAENFNVPGAFPEEDFRNLERGDIEEEVKLQVADSKPSEMLCASVDASISFAALDKCDKDGLIGKDNLIEHSSIVDGSEQITPANVLDVIQNLESLTGEVVHLSPAETKEAVEIALPVVTRIASPVLCNNEDSSISLASEKEVTMANEIEKSSLKEGIIQSKSENDDHQDVNVEVLLEKFTEFPKIEEEKSDPAENELINEACGKNSEAISFAESTPVGNPDLSPEVIQNIESLTGEIVRLSQDELDVLRESIKGEKSLEALAVDSISDPDVQAIEDAEADIIKIEQSLSPAEVEKSMKVIESDVSSDLLTLEIPQPLAIDISRPLSPAEVEDVINSIEFFTGEVVSAAGIQEIQNIVERKEELILAQRFVSAGEMGVTTHENSREIKSLQGTSECDEREMLTEEEINEIQNASKFVEAALESQSLVKELDVVEDDISVTVKKEAERNSKACEGEYSETAIPPSYNVAHSTTTNAAVGSFAIDSNAGITVSSSTPMDEIIASPSAACIRRQPLSTPSMEIVPVSSLKTPIKSSQPLKSPGCCGIF